MLPGYPGEHITRAEPWRGIVPTVHSVLAVCLPSLGGLSKEPHLHDGDGVSTYLALTFGTLLSSQGTDASFGLPLGLPPGASLQSCVSDSIRSFRLRFSPVRF